jgi:glycolate oxidase subunit GlcD
MTPSTMLERGLRADLERVVGAGAVIDDPERMLVYESDGLTRYRQAPRAVVLPRDTDECARAVRVLHDAGVPVVPRGAGTGLSGGAVAQPGAVVVGTARMNRILDLDVAARRARVQAGVVNAELSRVAHPHGLTYAPDPSSQSACTLGGNVAENSGGPHCLKYGVTSRYVVGLTVVGAGGEVMELRSQHQAQPLDVIGLFVGSEGCFGLATEIEVGLLPAPAEVRTLLAAFPRTDEAGAAVTAILAEGLVPAALEIVDGATIRAVEASIFAAGYPQDAGAALVVEFDGAEAGLDDEASRAADLCRAAGATVVRLAATPADRAALWQGRKKAFGAMGRLAPDLLVQDATVPRSRLPDVLREVDRIASQHGLLVANVFHAGDGNLHPNLLFDRRDADQVERVERASREIMQVCVAAGGTITGEHGVGLDKRVYLPLVCGPDELEAMAAVRRVFDPRGLFNPGKVLPDPPSDERREPSADRAADPDGPAPAPRPATAGEPGPARVLEGLEAEGLACDVVEADPPRIVASPADDAEAGRLLALASRRRWRVRLTGDVFRGGGAQRRARPSVDLFVSTRALCGIEAHEPADLTVTAGAGTAFAELDAHLEGARQWVALDGPGLAGQGLGQVAARADASVLANAFGAVRDQVLGLTVVTGDGRTLALGGQVVKNVAGFDLVRLLVGSRGALGMLTRLTLRTHPRPDQVRDLALRADVAHDLLPALERLFAAPMLPASVELASGSSGAELLVRVLGSEARVDHAVTHFSERMGAGVRVLSGEEAKDRREQARRPASTAALVLQGRPSARGFSRLLDQARVGRGTRAWALPDRGLLYVAPAAPEASGASSQLRPGRDAADTGPADRVRTIEHGLRAAFDPAGVLVGGAPPWRIA